MWYIFYLIKLSSLLLKWSNSSFSSTIHIPICLIIIICMHSMMELTKTSSNRKFTIIISLVFSQLKLYIHASVNYHINLKCIRDSFRHDPSWPCSLLHHQDNATLSQTTLTPTQFLSQCQTRTWAHITPSKLNTNYLNPNFHKIQY